MILEWEKVSLGGDFLYKQGSSPFVQQLHPSIVHKLCQGCGKAIRFLFQPPTDPRYHIVELFAMELNRGNDPLEVPLPPTDSMLWICDICHKSYKFEARYRNHFFQKHYNTKYSEKAAIEKGEEEKENIENNSMRSEEKQKEIINKKKQSRAEVNEEGKKQREKINATKKKHQQKQIASSDSDYDSIYLVGYFPSIQVNR